MDGFLGYNMRYEADGRRCDRKESRRLHLRQRLQLIATAETGRPHLEDLDASLLCDITTSMELKVTDNGPKDNQGQCLAQEIGRNHVLIA